MLARSVGRRVELHTGGAVFDGRLLDVHRAFVRVAVAASAMPAGVNLVWLPVAPIQALVI